MSNPPPHEDERVGLTPLGEQLRLDLEQVEDWFTYHAPTPHQQHLLDSARYLMQEVAEFLVVNVDPSRERSLALTALREARMWVNAAIVFDRSAS